MERQPNWVAITAIAGVLTLLFSILAGIPQIVRFYPDALSGLLESVPLDIVSIWGERLGIFLLGVSIGWLAHIRILTPSSESIDSIEGCVEVRDVAWKGTAKLSNGTVDGIDISHNPVCPDCQSPMNSEEVQRGHSGGLSPRSKNRAAMSGFNKSYFWKCPSPDCGYSSKKDFDGRDDALNLLEKHFDRITETTEEDYSLDALIETIQESGREVTPREVWQQYEDVVDDSNVSTKCFPQ